MSAGLHKAMRFLKTQAAATSQAVRLLQNQAAATSKAALCLGGRGVVDIHK